MALVTLSQKVTSLAAGTVSDGYSIFLNFKE
jgi:hypothetical protein